MKAAAAAVLALFISLAAAAPAHASLIRDPRVFQPVTRPVWTVRPTPAWQSPHGSPMCDSYCRPGSVQQLRSPFPVPPPRLAHH